MDNSRIGRLIAAICLAIACLTPCASAQQTQPVAVSYRDFSGGLNDNTAPVYLKTSESPDLLNVLFDDPIGALTQRKGYTNCDPLPSGNAVTVLASHITTGGDKYIIATDNQNYYYSSDCTGWTAFIDNFQSSAYPKFKTIRDKLVIVNQFDHPVTWDGTTITTHTYMPNAQHIEYWKERIWLARTDDEPSGLYFSALTDAGGTSIDPTDVDNATSTWIATNVIYISKDDGSPIHAIKVYRGNLYIFKETGIWRLLFESEFDVQVVQSVSNIGLISGGSIVEIDNLLLFTGNDGIYAFNGQECKRISDGIKNKFNDISQADANIYEKFKLWSSSADFSGGTFTNTFQTTGEVTVTSYTVTDDSYSDFSAYTATSNVTVNGSGAVGLAWGNALNDATFSGVGGYWTDTGFNYATGKACSDTGVGTTGAMLSIKKDGLTLLSNNAVCVSGETMVILESSIDGVDIDVGDTVQAFLICDSGETIYQDFTYRGGSLAVACNRIGSPGSYNTCFFQANANGYANTGYLESRVFDMGISSPTYGELDDDNYLPDDDDTVTYQISVATSSYGEWSSYAAVSDAGMVTADAKRYAKYKMTITQTTGDSPQVTAVNLHAFATGYYISPKYSGFSGITSWGGFTATESGGSWVMDYQIKFASSSAMLDSTDWTAITNPYAITASTDNYWTQWRVNFGTSTNVTTPLLQSVYMNGYAGDVAVPIVGAKVNNRYWLAVSTSGSTNNAILVKNRLPGIVWSLFDLPISAITELNNTYYGGIATSSAIVKLEDGYNDGGAAINAYWESRDETFGYPLYDKNVQEFLIDYASSSANAFTVYVSTDYGTTWDSKTVDMSTSSARIRQVSRKFFNAGAANGFRFKVGQNAADKPFKVYGMDIIGYAYPYRKD